MKWCIKLVLSLSLVGFGIFCGAVSYNTPLEKSPSGLSCLGIGATGLLFACMVCFVADVILTIVTVESDK
jgi:hypothetical protein